jgi:hypothetical protein
MPVTVHHLTQCNITEDLNLRNHTDLMWSVFQNRVRVCSIHMTSYGTARTVNSLIMFVCVCVCVCL